MLNGTGEETIAVMSEVAGIGDELKANEVALAQVQEKMAQFIPCFLRSVARRWRGRKPLGTVQPSQNAMLNRTSRSPS
jgi:hypothetical protein